MTSRRGENRIRGPHSALTDFLAANNISARQIRDDYERQQAAAAQQTTENGEDGDANEDEEALAQQAEASIARSRRRRQQQQQQTIARIKRNKANAKKKRKRKGRGDYSSSPSELDSDSDEEEMAIKDMYKKKPPLPGQLENCEICGKRFTVTPYSKTGPDGGLVCTPCGKEIANDAKGQKNSNGPKAVGRRRRKFESERLDGVIRKGPRSLVQQTLEVIVRHHNEIESFGSMPDHLLLQIGRIFTKNRVQDSMTLPLFLRPDMKEAVVNDCAKLKTEDYNLIVAQVPRLKRLILYNAYQFKDETLDYMVEKAKHLEHIHIYAANLVSSEKWSMLFRHRGADLTTIKLAWLDAAFEDEQVADMVKYCPNLGRLKLKYCWRIGPESIKEISKLQNLEHLSLFFLKEVPNDILIDLIKSIGPKLQTLSLEEFKDIDGHVLKQIHESCRSLKKLRIIDNDTATDEAFAQLFTNWQNPPLEFVDLGFTRDVDNQNPDGPADEPIGLGAKGFEALMAHSSSTVKTLKITGCRHIPLATLLDVFAPDRSYPELEHVDMSFVQDVDDVVLAGLFRGSQGSLKRVVLFGCFGVGNQVNVPSGVVVIGAPRIEQEGMEMYGAAGDEVPEYLMEAMEQEMRGVPYSETDNGKLMAV